MAQVYLYRDTERGDIFSYADLRKMWEQDTDGMRTGSESASFDDFLRNATDKNGFLEEFE